MEVPKWRSGLRHCNAMHTVSLQMLVQNLCWQWPEDPWSDSIAIGTVLSELGEGLAGQEVLVPLLCSVSCGGPLTWSTGVWCVLQHKIIFVDGYKIVIFRMTKSGHFVYIYLNLHQAASGGMLVKRRQSRVNSGRRKQPDILGPIPFWVRDESDTRFWVDSISSGPPEEGRFWADSSLLAGYSPHFMHCSGS
jgi:hypothetical protein